MMNQGPKRPVSVEDLLRLKRAERPPAEFWHQFDRELRAKQLAALVEKRPWWRELSFSRTLAGLRRYHLPLGATAILAVTVVSVRNYQPSHVTPAVVSQETAQVVAASLAVPANVVSLASVSSASETARTEAPVAAVVAAVQSETNVSALSLSVESAPLNSLAQIIPVLGAASGVDDATAPTSLGTKFGAENLAANQSIADVNFSNQLLTPARGFESRAMPARAKPVEPLAQIKIPTSRRSTLLASAIPVAVTGPVLNSERSARSLSDERLYDTVTRVSARGAGVAVKF